MVSEADTEKGKPGVMCSTNNENKEEGIRPQYYSEERRRASGVEYKEDSQGLISWTWQGQPASALK